ncbi:type II toxin-antitoxin system RatA family toxin [Agarilytica rhodophyticola]|uniref:type II toxin-antitoxin system RatA family toxin n=1 Tax=Agarilytica rhodophyticola TaxID=1737490 RepID=UPI000B344ED1|nr:type II toxin-antitoxin system RatA family toxin [Agarilytica rhodophyticola]
MKRIQRSALVPYSAEQMFALINDIPSYPEFMPGCVGSEVLQESADTVVARLDISRAGIKQSFVTRNTLKPPTNMSLNLEEGPFSSLKGEWEFSSLSEKACKISFWLEFEFTSKLIALAAGKVFEMIASEQVDAICQRAVRVYGKSE